MRIKSLDLARGFTALCIPVVHTVLLYARPAVYQTVFGHLLRFIAEGPGAQLFMVYMGISITLSTRLTWSAVAKRSLGLLAAGYGLNILKFIIPLKLGMLPAGLQNDLGILDPCGATLCDAASHLLLLGDILTFAAIALPISFLIFQLPKYGYYAVAAAVLVALLSPYAWDHYACSSAEQYLNNLLGGQPPTVFFPVFPWLVYPLIGLSIGYLLQRKLPFAFDYLGLFGFFFLLLGLVLARFEPVSMSFYRTCPADTAYHLGIVGLTLWVWHHLEHYVRPNYFFRVLQYCSQDITPIYIIQWPLIFWCLPIFGYQRLGYGATILTAALMTGLTIFLSLLANQLRLQTITIED